MPSRGAADANKTSKNNSLVDEETHVQELLKAGIPLAKVAELCSGRIDEKTLHKIAGDVVLQSDTPDAELGIAVLQGSESARGNPDFMNKCLESLRSEAPEELLDPLMSTLMTDPVVISTGYVLDRRTAVDENGHLRFQTCPFTRAPLKCDVYPLVDRHRKLKEFKQQRFAALIGTAKTLLNDHKIDELTQVVAVAEEFIDDLGEDTYRHESRRLAEICLAAAKIPGRGASPAEYARIYIRIHRAPLPEETSECNEAVRGFAFLVDSGWQALREDRLDEAVKWYEACDKVHQVTRIASPFRHLHLEIAKRRLEDLRVPRQLRYAEVRHDPEALKLFLEAEGIALDDVLDRTPFGIIRVQVDDRTADDDWHVAARTSPLESRVDHVKISVGQFRDQGWGNAKANLSLALYDGTGSLVARCNLFGTYRSEGYTYGPSPSRTLERNEDVVSKAQPGHVYSLEYAVGAGGGHELKVRSWACRVYPERWNTGFVRCVFDDPEGGRGMYDGPHDESLQAHGLGELEYNDGDLFIGNFCHGKIVEGVVYTHGHAACTVTAGRRTDRLDASIIERFPFATGPDHDLNGSGEVPSASQSDQSEEYVIETDDDSEPDY